MKRMVCDVRRVNDAKSTAAAEAVSPSTETFLTETSPSALASAADCGDWAYRSINSSIFIAKLCKSTKKILNNWIIGNKKFVMAKKIPTFVVGKNCKYD